MASVRAGVVTGVEVNSPQVMAGTDGGKLLEWSPATWSLIWFIVAIVVLFFIL